MSRTTSRNFRRGVLAAVGVAAALVATTPAAFAANGSGDKPAAASPAGPVFNGPIPSGFSSWPELMRVQQQLDRAADQVDAFAAGPGGDGYASTVVDPEQRRLRVYWKGELPDQARMLIRGLSTQNQVDVRPAAFSAAELRTAAATAIADADNELETVGPQPDGSGLQATVRGTLPAAAMARSVRLDGSDGASLNVPVTLASGGGISSYSRAHDSNPFWGGAQSMNPGAKRCSTGFSVRTGDGATKLVTAAHCAPNNSVIRTVGSPSTATVLGTTEQTDMSHDIALIRPEAGKSAAGTVYSGSFPAGSGSGFAVDDDTIHDAIVDVHSNHYGDYICTDGGLSGLFCNNIQIDGVNLTRQVQDSSGKTWTVGPLVHATQKYGKAAAGHGDSGGPVLDLVFTNPTQNANFVLYARGTIESGSSDTQPAPCNGEPTYGDRQCSTDVLYVPMETVLSRFGATIVKG